MLSSAQYNKILALHNQGHSIRNINRITGHARKTIRHVTEIKVPPLPKISSKPSKIDDYKNIVREKFDFGTFTARQIYDDIYKYGYAGSYSTVNRYFGKLLKQKESADKKKHRTRGNRDAEFAAWVLSLLQGKISVTEIEQLFADRLDIKSINSLYKDILENSLRYRNRSVTIFAYLKNIPKSTIAKILGIERQTVRTYINKFESGGTAKLFDFSRKETKKVDAQEYKEKVFQILHSPPASFSFNRTSWRLEDLYQTMKSEGFPLAKAYIHKIIKNAGYRFRKARTVLTSNDPNYKEKVQSITNILSNLGPKEKFFSIDEYGPFAVKLQGGRALVPPGTTKTVPQWQKSKGSIIATAALELTTNQITHFYSNTKNTAEMIKLLDFLIEKYAEEDIIYFSWDAASWHASKALYKRVIEINSSGFKEKTKSPIVKLAPLPTCAQFLNIIESVFSGMARAIIHNSDYASVDACKSAIDTYFSERNNHFQNHPKRAGNKLWGKERVPVTFKESNNCKDPLYR